MVSLSMGDTGPLQIELPRERQASMNPSVRLSGRGIALLEMMVALAILGLITVGLMTQRTQELQAKAAGAAGRHLAELVVAAMRRATASGLAPLALPQTLNDFAWLKLNTCTGNDSVGLSGPGSLAPVPPISEVWEEHGFLVCGFTRALGSGYVAASQASSGLAQPLFVIEARPSGPVLTVTIARVRHDGLPAGRELGLLIEAFEDALRARDVVYDSQAFRVLAGGFELFGPSPASSTGRNPSQFTDFVNAPISPTGVYALPLIVQVNLSQVREQHLRTDGSNSLAQTARLCWDALGAVQPCIDVIGNDFQFVDAAGAPVDIRAAHVQSSATLADGSRHLHTVPRVHEVTASSRMVPKPDCPAGTDAKIAAAVSSLGDGSTAPNWGNEVTSSPDIGQVSALAGISVGWVTRGSQWEVEVSVPSFDHQEGANFPESVRLAVFTWCDGPGS